jgi:uncharacterized protein
MIEEFLTTKGEKLSKDKLISEIVDFIKSNDSFTYRILVGTDSEYFLNSKADFVSVIVVHRIGEGARYFWRREIISKKFSLGERLWQEAILSINISQELLKVLTNLNLNLEFEIHLDLGINGKSSSSLKEIINLVRGYGFEIKIKPQSYAASKIADRLI